MQPPLPVSRAEFFCKSGKDPDFIWPRLSHVVTGILLFVFYGAMLVPLSLVTASATMGPTQVKVVKQDKETVIKVPAEVLFDLDKSDLRPTRAASWSASPPICVSTRSAC
jgi:hypothetical protein